MITEDDVLITYQDICREFPGLRLVWKPGSGRCGPTIGTWFFISSAWGSYTPYRRYEILRHERIHMRQYQRLGLGSVWLGVLPFLLAYLLLPFPIGFAWCRYAFERAAFVESMRVVAEEQGMSALMQKRLFYVDQLTGRPYLWCWPWRGMVGRWVAHTMTLIGEEGHNGI